MKKEGTFIFCRYGWYVDPEKGLICLITFEQKGVFFSPHLLAKVIVANRKTTRNEFARFSFSLARLQTLTRAKNRGPSSLHWTWALLNHINSSKGQKMIRKNYFDLNSVTVPCLPSMGAKEKSFSYFYNFTTLVYKSISRFENLLYVPDKSKNLWYINQSITIIKHIYTLTLILQGLLYWLLTIIVRYSIWLTLCSQSYCLSPSSHLLGLGSL